MVAGWRSVFPRAKVGTHTELRVRFLKMPHSTSTTAAATTIFIPQHPSIISLLVDVEGEETEQGLTKSGQVIAENENKLQTDNVPCFPTSPTLTPFVCHFRRQGCTADNGLNIVLIAFPQKKNKAIKQLQLKSPRACPWYSSCLLCPLQSFVTDSSL